MWSVDLPVVVTEAGDPVAVSVMALIVLGFTVGCLAGFFGVGGGFVLNPMLDVLLGIPLRFVVGSGLTQMFGMSASGCWRHRSLGNIDFRLGLVAAIGIFPGVEIGAQLLQSLQRMGSVAVFGVDMLLINLVLRIIYSLMLGFMAYKMWRESRRAILANAMGASESRLAVGGLGRWLRALRLRPMLPLPVSGIESISIWGVVGVGLVAGTASGLLGIGGGFIFMPALIYVVGVPTSIAVGTSLFATFLAASYGTMTDSLKGNVDLVLVMLLLVPSAIGAQIGALLTKRAGGPRTRQCFSVVAAFAMIIVITKLILEVVSARSLH